MALSEADKLNIKEQIAQTEDKIASQKLASEGLNGKEAEAKANEAVFQRQWQRSHFIIHSYEKEIEKINGEHIAAPFSEADVFNQALEKGRLYQAPANQDPKTIPEMVGGGLAANPKTPHEGTYITLMNRLITTILSGDNGGASATSSTLKNAYTAGSATIVTNGLLTSNRWYVIGGLTYVKIGTATSNTTTTGIAPNQVTTTTHSATISERYPVSGLDNSVSSNASVIGFNGYTNTERTSGTATTTGQAVFNSFYNSLKAYIGLWKFIIEEQLTIQLGNPDPSMSAAAKATNQSYMSQIEAYADGGYKIGDGALNINVIQTMLTNRAAYRVSRPLEAKAAKSDFYPERANLTKMRCNIQAGTLTRVKFLDTLRTLVPPAGDPNLAKTLKSLKAMLEQG